MFSMCIVCVKFGLKLKLSTNQAQFLSQVGFFFCARTCSLSLKERVTDSNHPKWVCPALFFKSILFFSSFSFESSVVLCFYNPTMETNWIEPSRAVLSQCSSQIPFPHAFNIFLYSKHFERKARGLLDASGNHCKKTPHFQQVSVYQI